MFGKKKNQSLCLKTHFYVHLLSFVHKNTKKHAKTTKNTKKHKKIDHKLEFIRVYALRHWTPSAKNVAKKWVLREQRDLLYLSVGWSNNNGAKEGNHNILVPTSDLLKIS